MKKIICFLFILIAFNSTAQLKDVTLDDVWSKGTFRESGIDAFKPFQDGASYVQLTSEGNLSVYSYSSGKKTKTLISISDFEAAIGDSDYGLDDLIWSNDEKQIMIPTKTEFIYRHSSANDFIIYDIENKKAQPLSVNGKQQEASFSNDGYKVAFVRNNNLFYKDLKSGAEIQVTTDGVKNSIINGIPDWVYEEEFSFAKAYEWSTDGKKIAWIKFDESEVPEYTLQYFNEHYPENYTYKYPKVGEKNSVVSVWIYDLETKQSVKADIGNDAEQYIPRIKWTNDSKLCITRLNRLQNKLELLYADAVSGKTTVVFTENNKYYIDITDDLTFLNDNSFIRTSMMDGYNHIYHYGADGKLINLVTAGKWDVTAFYGVDEKNKLVYYQSAENSPLERNVYVISLDGKNKKIISALHGTNNAEFNPAFTYFLRQHSSANSPNKYSICKADGKEVRLLEDNKSLTALRAKYKISPREFFNFTTKEGVVLNGWIMKPLNFDATKKYPVLMHVYGGPGDQQVLDMYMGNRDMNLNYLCQQGYIIACVDNRGSGARGEEFLKCTYLQLGKLETADQISGARYLQTLAYVDANRVGIIGWSYGGYMSCMCIAQGNDVFKTAVAIAPVTDWRFYDTIYTERYMRTNKENKSGYDSTSPVLFADKIKGNFLIVAGLSDDNVHYQNTAQMLKALYANNVKFEQMTFPDKNHGIYGGNTRLYLYTNVFEFLEKNL